MDTLPTTEAKLSGGQLPAWLQTSSETPSLLAAIMSVAKRRTFVRTALCVGLLMLFFQLHNSASAVRRYALRSNHSNDVYNATLGFQRAFTISLSERTDKRDLSTLAASFAGFQVEYVPGVKYDDVIDKAAPSVSRGKIFHPTSWSTWLISTPELGFQAPDPWSSRMLASSYERSAEDRCRTNTVGDHH
jgi:hypothetical protein